MMFEKIKENFKDNILDTHQYRGDHVVIAKKEIIFDLLKFLKTDPELDFNVLMDLTAVDYLWMEREIRFDVVYHLYSLGKNHRLRVKVGVDEKAAAVQSVVSLWPAANWFEREVWDMFGIRFEGHPDLKRILLHDQFVGHPLRKDYPIFKQQPLIDLKEDALPQEREKG